MRDSGPISTTPGRAGSFAAASLAACSAAFAFAMPAINATLTPPREGTGNSCDVSVSPSTVAVACTVAPAGSPLNCARPCSSVFVVRLSPPTVNVTSCPATLLPIRSRTTRTVTVPAGNSGAGSGVPAIAEGSGMSTCASITAVPLRTINNAVRRVNRVIAVQSVDILWPQFLQNFASASFCVSQLPQRPAITSVCVTGAC